MPRDKDEAMTPIVMETLATRCDVAPDSYPVGPRVWGNVNRSPSLDQAARLFPGASVRAGRMPLTD